MLAIFPQCIACIVALAEITLAIVISYLAYKDLHHKTS